MKSRMLKAEDSKTLSVLALYLIMPCVILMAFQVDYTKEVRNGLILAIFASVVIHIGLILLNELLKRVFHLNSVEQASVIYSNAGNLIIPLVTSMLGKEWVIYSSAFVSVQLFLMWSHGKAVLCGERKFEIWKVLTNVNMVSIIVGMILFITGIRFPTPLVDALNSIGTMIGPTAMLVMGMLISRTNIHKIMEYKRLWLIAVLRLVGMPLLCLLFLKYSGIASFVPNGEKILLITLLATMTPSASTITQMAQVYDKDADYASAINVVTTILCIVTMPGIVSLYLL